MTLAMSGRAPGTLQRNIGPNSKELLMVISIAENEIIEDFLVRVPKEKFEEQFAKFMDIFRKVHVYIPLLETISQVPIYAKFMKDILSKNRKLDEFETITLNEECITILQLKLPPKLKDLGSFKISCSIRNNHTFNDLCNSKASINLMPLLSIGN